MMKKLLFLMATLFMITACYDETAVLGRLDALEQAAYQSQLDALKSSLTSLEAVDTAIKSTIETLENTDEDYSEQIDLLKNCDKTLEKNIADLQTLVDQKSSDTKDWVEKTFATLEQYNSIVGQLNTLNDLLMEEVEKINTIVGNNYNSLLDKIEEAQSSIGDWVHETLKAYYTSEQIDNLLSALKADLGSLQTELDTLEQRVSELEKILGGLSKEFTIAFSQSEVAILPGKSSSVEYTITGATSTTTIKAFGQNGWYAKVTPTTESTGVITVTAPGLLTEDEIIVLVHDGQYRSIMATINFVSGVFSSVISVEEVPVEGGDISLSITTNMSYEVVIPKEAQSWLSVVETKAIQTDNLTIQCKANEGLQRNAIINLVDAYKNVQDSFAIFQKGNEVSDMSINGTANCYIVSTDGFYKFKTVKGNSSESVGDVVSAEVLWETFGNDIKPNVGDLIQEVSYSDNYITFKTPSTFAEGNAVIAAKNADGKILWSWHIWLTDEPADQVYNNNAGTMMDRNLGATSATPGDVGALGLLYQWGRKDPFLSGGNINTNMRAESTITWPPIVKSTYTEGTIEYATANPTVFINNNSYNLDWYYTGSEAVDNTRWMTLKTIYDPCPKGYQVPYGDYHNNIWETAFGSEEGYYPGWDEKNRGYHLGGTIGSIDYLYLTSEPCWYPTAGEYSNDSDGGPRFVGSDGNYWTSITDTRAAYYFSINFQNKPYFTRAWRYYCYSVRCQKIL